MTDIKQCDSCGKQDVLPYCVPGAELVMTLYIRTVADKPDEKWYLCRECAMKKLDRIRRVIKEEDKE